MENFEELQKLLSEQYKLNEYIDRISSLGYYGGSSLNSFGISRNENGRYTLSGLEKIIGTEKFDSIVEQFKGLLTVELFKIKTEKSRQVGLFEVVKYKEGL